MEKNVPYAKGTTRSAPPGLDKIMEIGADQQMTNSPIPFPLLPQTPLPASSSKKSKKPPRTPKKDTPAKKRKTSSTPKKPFYDEKDLEALKLMQKLRVDWSAEEDSFLLTCRVAGSYLSQNSSVLQVPYTLIRDELHKRYQSSLNKTSRACQRRLSYMLKNSLTMNSVTLRLSVINQDKSIVTRFPLPKEKLGKEENEKRIHDNFVPLLVAILEKFKNAETETMQEIGDSLEDIRDRFNINYPKTSIRQDFSFPDPSDENDLETIRGSVIHSTMLSNLCCKSDKANWSFYLYKIYQQYSDATLRNTFDMLKKSKMVAGNKKNKPVTAAGDSGEASAPKLPLSSSPYKLSTPFIHMFLTRYQERELFSQTKDFIQKLNKNPEQSVEVKINQEGGYVSAIIGMMARNNLGKFFYILYLVILINQRNLFSV